MAQQKDRIKAWRKNAGLTQADMSGIFEIPKRTVESWEMGERECPEWAEKLLIEKLVLLSKDHCEQILKWYAKEKGLREDGERPLVRWAVRTADGEIHKAPGINAAVDIRQTDGDGEIICYLADKNGDFYYPDDPKSETVIRIAD